MQRKHISNYDNSVQTQYFLSPQYLNLISSLISVSSQAVKLHLRKIPVVVICSQSLGLAKIFQDLDLAHYILSINSGKGKYWLLT